MQQSLLPVEGPYRFDLIPKLFLRSKERQMPYKYLPSEWSSLIPIFEREIPVTVKPRNSGRKSFLEISIYDNISSKEKKKILEIVSHVFSTNLELDAFYEIANKDQQLRNVVLQLKGLKPYFSISPYHSLIRTVVRQLISAQAALAIMSNLVIGLGNSRKIGNQIFYGMPSPERLAKASKNQLISCGVGYKWKLIKELSLDIVNGHLDLEELSEEKDEDIIERLKEYNGIGDWTARTFLFDGFRKQDAYPKYDISIVKAISILYHDSEQIGRSEVDEFFDKYSKHHGIAVSYLFGYLWLLHHQKMVDN